MGWRTPARASACRECRSSISNAVYFLTDVNGLKDDQVEQFPIVTLAFADTGAYKYVSITGYATVTDDRAKIKDLWTPDNKAFWDSER